MKRPEGIDKKVIEKITECGGDLNKKRHVDFFLYFETEYDAVIVETELMNLGFRTEVSQSSYNEKWGCYAHKKMVVTEKRLIEISKWFESLAQKNNGEYDGWGTEI